MRTTIAKVPYYLKSFEFDSGVAAAGWSWLCWFEIEFTIVKSSNYSTNDCDIAFRHCRDSVRELRLILVKPIGFDL